jgi:hypothetical protein
VLRIQVVVFSGVFGQRGNSVVELRGSYRGGGPLGNATNPPVRNFGGRWLPGGSFIRFGASCDLPRYALGGGHRVLKGLRFENGNIGERLDPGDTGAVDRVAKGEGPTSDGRLLLPLGGPSKGLVSGEDLREMGVERQSFVHTERRLRDESGDVVRPPRKRAPHARRAAGPSPRLGDGCSRSFPLVLDGAVSEVRLCQVRELFSRPGVPLHHGGVG